MHRRIVFLLATTALLGLTLSGTAFGFSPNTDASLVGWWTLDEMSGTTAADSSPNGNDGTLQGDPEWVEGVLGGALDLDGNGDYVNCGNDAVFNITEQVTLAAWVNTRDMGNSQDNPWVGKGDTAYMLKGFRTGYDIEFFIYDSTWNSAHYITDDSFNGTWHHVAGTFDGSELKIYVDGTVGATLAHAGTINSVAYSINIGRNSQNTTRYYDGMIDDVRIYSQALTEAEIQAVMTGGANPALAVAPKPENEATDVPRDVVLGWTPGPYAASHDVYLGTSFEDVNAAGATSAQGLQTSLGQDANTYDPGRLDFGQTYYWRVDEVNAAPDNTVHQGVVWSFTVEPELYQVTDITATSSAPNDVGRGPDNLVDGAGLDEAGQQNLDETVMWVGNVGAGESAVLQFDFERVYKIEQAKIWNYNHQFESFLNFSVKDVTIEYATEPNEWIILGDYQLTQGPGQVTYTGQVLDLGGVAARSVRMVATSNYGGMKYGLSEVQFFYTPVHAREPMPAAGATGVSLDPTLSWRAGREAASHEIYLSTDVNAVADGTALIDTAAVASYDLSSLDLATDYYWRVDEVNTAEAISTWAGETWSFTTQMFTTIDDFESYTEAEGNEVFSTWLDGFEITTNGSVVGHNDPPYVEGDIVASGDWSMPFSYSNTGGASVSEAERTFTPPQDWTKGGAQTLTISFYGAAGNTGQLYLKINGTKVPYNSEMTDLASPMWHQWQVDLSTLGNVTSVRTLTLGIEGAGATGMLYFDEIRLYPNAVEPITPVQPDAAGLVLHYSLDEGTGTVARDTSGSANNGTLVGGATWSASGKVAGALSLDGFDGYVDAGNGASLGITDVITLSAWVNMADAGNGEHNPFITKGDQAYAIKHSSANEIQAFVYVNNGWRTANVDVDESFNGEWHHVACTYDGQALKLYVDGALQTTTEYAGSIASATYNVNVGRNAQNTDRLYNGLIDEVWIYQRVLSAAGIAGLAGRTQPIYEPF
ncbi:MAG: discoidin domain-containing protein [Sedimentisphaerales bacterium]|nr:discoidin domain-containing protein [Sedimentisphaerales bacterium]